MENRPSAGPVRAAPLSAAVAAIVSLAAGALPSPQAHATEHAEPAAVVEMTDELTFEPARITVRAGDTVEWRNPSRVPHTVTADPAKAQDPEHVQLPEGAETFDSGVVQPEETFRYTFEVPGQYQYFCIPHEAQGMVGEVTVGP